MTQTLRAEVATEALRKCYILATRTLAGPAAEIEDTATLVDICTVIEDVLGCPECDGCTTCWKCAATAQRAEDAEMLDWLENAGLSTKDGVPNVHSLRDMRTRKWSWTVYGRYFTDLRSAIRAAMGKLEAEVLKVAQDA